jgi:acyl-coenzyme A synthetase/AMP-(fatty) acid ligase
LVPAGTSAGTEAAFLFQTSGTAGEPKWVQCHYWKCFEVVECMWREGALDHARGQTVLLTPPLFHSYGLSALFEYTRAAGTIVFPSPGSRLGPLADLQDGRLADRVTAIEGVPYFHQQLARLASRLKLPALMHLGFGGGALDESAVATLRAVFPALTYSVRYGLTETPSVVSHKLFRPPYAEDWLSSGRILPIYRVCIGDADGRALAPGSEGEIIVSGTCVCRYFGAGADPANDTLRTGDIGRLTAQGELVVVGRGRAFLKHLGYRLSPEHIESVLRAVPGVVDCRVVTRLSSLVAEIVAKDDLFSREGLFRHAAASLPAHAVPNEVVRVERIPRTASGKIMRH